ncbi:MAG: SH3 domain-containing protein [Saprospirales bacterium]|jgi:hypothetical protein|nr:SH3 domain-containing protein [Saprospirales bacterium]
MPQFVRGSDGRIYEIQDSGDGAGVFAIMIIAAMMAAYNAYLWLLSHYIFVGCITLFGFITWVGWVYHEHQQGESRNAIGKKISSFLLILVGFGLFINGWSRAGEVNTISEPVQQPAATVQPKAPKKTTVPPQPTKTNPNLSDNPNPTQANNIGEKSPTEIGYVKTEYGSPLRMRSFPSDTAKIVIMVKNGEAVTILEYAKEEAVVNGERGHWCKIKYGNNEGWAWGKFISKEK